MIHVGNVFVTRDLDLKIKLGYQVSWATPGTGKGGGYLPPPGNAQMGSCYCYELYVRVLKWSMTVPSFVLLLHV